MEYVTHTCKQCGCAFNAEDYTNAQDIPPHWRYCPECSKISGIDYEKQKPGDYRSEKQKEFYKRFSEMGKQNLKKFLALNQK